MSVIMTIGSREITEADAAFIRQLIAEHPKATRTALAKKICEAWDWRQRNGFLKQGVCRTMIVRLHRAGYIQLPPSQPTPFDNRKPAGQRRSQSANSLPIDQTPIEAPLAALQPLTFRQVRRTAQEPLFRQLMEQHHELGYTHPIGEHLKFLVYSGKRVVAALAWSSAPYWLGPRDRFIGWSPEARDQNRYLLAYNSRFLIPPWVRVPHLASHILGRMARRLSDDWERIYAHPIYFLETFIDPARHYGTCYRAANWIVMGQTSGRGHRCPTREPNRSIKQVLGYPMTPRFRELLGGCDFEVTRTKEEQAHTPVQGGTHHGSRRSTG